MKLSRESIIVGGLPNPIGGVTTFLSRLVKAYPHFVLAFVDLYASNDKKVPHSLGGKYKLLPNKFRALLEICRLQIGGAGKMLFFNFSTGNSLLFFLLLPKFRNEWSLMLHHGHLASKLPKIMLKIILNKFDIIYTLNERQTKFYKSIDENLPLIRESSYVPAVLVDIPNIEKIVLNDKINEGYKILIGSGSPTKLYQHHLLVELAMKKENTFLFLFLYGEGELKQELLDLKHPRVKVFINKDEDIFNFYLAKSNLYLRPALEDSFGIACADAVEFGVPVIASNVCERYSGVHTYELNSNQEFYELSNKFI